MELPQRAHLHLDSDLGALAQVLSWFNQFSHPLIPREVWLQCELMLTEGFTNAVRHAHRGLPRTIPIHIEVILFLRSIEIRIWDHGGAFDLEKKISQLPEKIDKDAESGRGLWLLKKMSNVLKYPRTPDGRNCLLIIKNYVPDPIDPERLTVMELPQQAKIQLDSDLNALAHVLSWFSQFSHPSIPHEVWLQCELMLAEGFTNAVRHAHRGLPSNTPVCVDVMLFPERVEIRIWDQGRFFDLNQKMQELPEKVDPDAEGGRGLWLLKKMASEVDYTAAPEGGNCLRIMKEFVPNLVEDKT